MGLASEMKNLSEEIVSSFKQRIKENEELVIEVQKTLDGFRKDHQEMAAALRAGLDKDEVNRMKEFVALMKSIKEEISEIFTYTTDLLAKFDKEHQDMAAGLRADLDKGEVNRMKEFVALMKSIKEEISEIFTYTTDLLAKFDKEHQDMAAGLRAGLDKDEVNRMKEFAVLMKSINEEILRIFTYTHDMLAKFDKEHQEMSVELRKDLANGEVERIKEYNEVMKGIQNDVKNLKKAVAELLGDFAQDRGEASAAWKKMSDILAQLRKTAVTPPKEEVKKAEKKEVKKEIAAEIAEETPAEVVEEIPVQVKPKPVVPPMTLEEKVLDYINKHHNGVRISEMEEPLGETRMKLGFTAKNLLDEGKVLKIENIYYPISK